MLAESSQYTSVAYEGAQDRPRAESHLCEDQYIVDRNVACAQKERTWEPQREDFSKIEYGGQKDEENDQSLERCYDLSLFNRLFDLVNDRTQE